MKTSEINCTNFGAKYIKQTYINKLDSITGKYKPTEANFVEIERNNPLDVLALHNNAKYWENEMYASNIAYTASQMLSKSPFFVNKKIYALTSQKDSFNELKDEKILGLVELTEENNRYINLDFLQVKPEILYSLTPKPLKNIGTRILDCIKEIYHNKFILLTSRAGKTTEFYEKNDFVNIDKENNKYLWHPKK